MTIATLGWLFLIWWFVLCRWIDNMEKRMDDKMNKILDRLDRLEDYLDEKFENSNENTYVNAKDVREMLERVYDSLIKNLWKNNKKTLAKK